MLDQLANIETEYLEKINNAEDLKTLDDLYLALFGKNGVLTLLPKDFPQLPKDEVKTVAPLFNKTKQELDDAIARRREYVREAGYANLVNETLDLEQANELPRDGKLHPLTQFVQETVDLFEKLGFVRFDAPDIDTDYNNFEVLHIPEQHPARDLWDTFYIDSEKYGIEPGKLLMRTHTSNSQIHIMKGNKPPIKMMVIGPCYRYENLDARHEHTFDQFEIVYIDKSLSMAHLQYLSEYFLKAIFGEEIKVRLKPKYYPFVEPGAGVDGLCIFCKGKGCKICGGVGWLELAGAGMIHPEVLKNGGIDPNEYSGIAWGMGPGRMVMLKNGINDLRVFRSGNLKDIETR